MKKALSLILALIMIVSAIPMTAYADKGAYDFRITIDTKIAGKTPADYKDFITLEGEGVTLGNEGLIDCVYPDKDFPLVYHEAEVFEAGTTYSGTVYVYPQEGYFLPPEFENYDFEVNGEEHSVNVNSRFVIKFEPVLDSTGEHAEYVAIRLHFRVEEPDPTGLARIPYAISQFFLAIATFFTETFIQPIVDLLTDAK